MSNNTTMNRKEKIMGFAYVLILFLTISSTCCILLFMYNSGFSSVKKREYFISNMDHAGEYRVAQKKAAATIDLLQEKISGYDPGVNAVYEDDNIKFLVNELKDIYDRHPLDTRYKSFLHIANFYYMWYADKKTLWTHNANIARFSKYMEDCELGLNTKKDDFSKLKR